MFSVNSLSRTVLDWITDGGGEEKNHGDAARRRTSGRKGRNQLLGSCPAFISLMVWFVSFRVRSHAVHNCTSYALVVFFADQPNQPTF